MDNTEVDTAILLENSVRDRVLLIVRQEVERAVVNHIGKVINDEKAKMLMEISIKVGQMLKGIEDEGRKPLWDSKPEDFGMSLTNFDSQGTFRNKEDQDAIRK